MENTRKNFTICNMNSNYENEIIAKHSISLIINASVYLVRRSRMKTFAHSFEYE